MWSCGGWHAQRASTVDQSPLCRVIVPRQGEGDAKLRWVLMGTTPASLQGLTCRGQRPTLPLPQSPPMHTDGAPQGPSKLAAEEHRCHLVGSGPQGITELISGYIIVCGHVLLGHTPEGALVEGAERGSGLEVGSCRAASACPLRLAGPWCPPSQAACTALLGLCMALSSHCRTSPLMRPWNYSIFQAVPWTVQLPVDCPGWPYVSSPTTTCQ